MAGIYHVIPSCLHADCENPSVSELHCCNKLPTWSRSEKGANRSSTGAKRSVPAFLSDLSRPIPSHMSSRFEPVLGRPPRRPHFEQPEARKSLARHKTRSLGPWLLAPPVTGLPQAAGETPTCAMLLCVNFHCTCMTSSTRSSLGKVYRLRA